MKPSPNFSVDAALYPAFLAVLGLIATSCSGWFDVQRTRVANEKILLEAQRAELALEIKNEENKFAQLKAENAALHKTTAAQQSEITQLSALIASQGGTNTVNVVKADSTSWTADSTVPWISLSTRKGTGNGTIQFSVSQNESPNPRTGTTKVGGIPFQVTQAGNTNRPMRRPP
jgi:Viral BACON domain